MKNNKPLIIWEKWTNPLVTEKESLDDNYDDDNYEDDIDDNFSLDKKTTSVIITPLGIVPFEEIKDCDKVFNFWTGHTNFSISHTIANAIEAIDGVETLDIFTRYRFRVGFGKAFKDREVMNHINDKVYEILS